MLKLKSESGMVLLVALMVTFLGSVLVGSYMSMVTNESRHSVRQQQRVQSLFLAEAGVQRGLYYLNNPENQPEDWEVDEDGNLITPLQANGNLAGGNYSITLYGKSQFAWLPERSYLVVSDGVIPRTGGNDIENSVSCIVIKLADIDVPAALAILDDPDIKIDLSKFNSAKWTIDGKDMDAPGGLWGIALANDGVLDDLEGQLGNNIDQVDGWSYDTEPVNGEQVNGADAILKDPSLPQNLDSYANYFRRAALDISNPDGVGQYQIPDGLLGTSDSYQILYANLSRGPIKISGQSQAYGVLVLEGDGEMELTGGSEWHGVIICAGDSNISLKGGGNTPAHIYGALLIANGIAEMNGSADIQYSSINTGLVDSELLLYQVYSWCGGWGIPLESEGSYPVVYQDE